MFIRKFENLSLRIFFSIKIFQSFIIQETQKEIAELKQTINGLENKVAGFEKTIAGFENTIAGVENTVARLENSIKILIDISSKGKRSYLN